MGFLQHDTNNIIVDATLTNKGREFLARNDGSFSIVKFAAADDDVDYSVIEKFGRTVGKEKIEKNTPVLEAQTVSRLAQKYRLISISNPNLIRLPSLSIVSGATNNVISLGRTRSNQETITVQQQLAQESEVPPELRDQTFIIEMSNQFLRVINVEPDNVDGSQRAMYVLTRDATTTGIQGSKLTFTIQTQSITEAQFDVFGFKSSGASTNDTIRTFVRVSGLQSGAVVEATVDVSRTG